MDKKERRQDYKSDNKILFMDKFEYNKEQRVINICFKSAKYNARRHVINTATVTERGVLKGAKDGDSEKNHISIKFFDELKPVCFFETNYYGIGFGRIIQYLNLYIKKYHNSIEGDKIRYKFIQKNIISKDFLRSLENIHKIKVVTLTVDRENIKVSDSKSLSGRSELSEDADIVLKPSGDSIFENTVKKFYNLYNNPNKPVKRVTVSGDSDEKKHISFDTEQMKQKRIISVESDLITGEVKTSSIFSKFLEEMEEL